ncbi:MAG: hypothetical protein IGS38_00895 [Synechococcales cyanobacterium M58_A2018_015]|nr:hypothetical protein [Synechococcales cyanobacterium M58_A2018_015]
MAIKVNPNEVLKLIKFIAAHGISDPNDYRFVVDPSLNGLDLRVDLIVTYLPDGDKITVVLDP